MSLAPHIFDLTNEKQFAILRQRPHFVIDKKLKLIYMIADNFQARGYIVRISKRLFSLCLNLVRFLSGVDHLGDLFLDNRAVTHDLLYRNRILRRKLLTLVAGEQSANLHHIVKKDRQIAGGYGDNVIYGKITEHHGLQSESFWYTSPI